ncbi:MAG: branched-chain amino acid aminotransferase [Bacteroidetes bacterium]|nr:MAG: branched-chain amino acid aminotransferase [Bacteroidota bacterium]
MYYDSHTLIFQDGEFKPVSEIWIDPFSQSLHYGNAVFEGMRAYHTKEGPRIFKPQEHFERFLRSAALMHITLPYSTSELITIAYKLLEINQLRDAYIRPLLMAGPNLSLTAAPGFQLLMMAWKWGRLLGNSLVHLNISSRERTGAQHGATRAKVSGYYAGPVSAMAEARSQGFHDAVLLDAEGYISQATGANLFMEKAEVLYTPPEDHVFPGITRSTVIELASELGFPVVERRIRPEELLEADGVFLSGTAAEIAGVATINRVQMRLPWDETLGYIISRKYHHRVTRGDGIRWTVI